ncbi:MAG: AAA family ATPase, partial [Anaerolineae bacterium]|nr:AAA family ATPase [Anaerolineae bacterium]
TLNQILVEMDGFDTDTNVIIVAATNRPDILDPALLRPGRFDRRVIMDQPDVKGRRAILDIHVRGKPLAEEVDLDAVARGTPGFVGADIENMVNESAILAARRNRRTISQAELTEAVERVALGGPERHSRVISAEEKRIVAYHEAGHASLRKLLPNTDPVYKISIIPRGQAAGYVLSFPEEDRGLVTQPWFEDFIAVALGGRVAEELIFDEITDGARDDLDRVTQIARRMVTRFGMSKTLGPMVYGRKQEMVFLGREMSEQRDYSEAIAIEIDREVKAIVDHAYQKARTSLQENIDKLKLVAETLIEIETLTADEFNALWDSDNAAEVLPPPTPQPLPTRPPERRREESRSGGPQTNTPPNPAPSPA